MKGREATRMERRGVGMVASMFMFIMFMLCSLSVSAASTTTRMSVPQDAKYEYYSERLRRNLLANGLGSTPPMGSLSNFFSLTLIAVISFLHRIVVSMKH